MSLGLFALARPGIEQLLETVVVLLFFAVPVLRSIFAAKKKEGERKPRPRAPQRTAPRADPRPDGGLDTWERLLRGEIELEQRPAAPPPLPAPVRKPAPAKPPPAKPPLVSTAPEELGPQMSTVSENEIETSGEDVSAPQPLDALREQMAAEDLTLSPIAMGAELGSESAAGASAAPAPHRTLGTLGALGVDLDWRRAVVLSEVLATPLALRRERADSLPGFQ